MKKLGALLNVVILLLSISISSELMSQTKEGFYDTENYDLRNVPGHDPEGNILQDVAQPPSFQRPSLSSPKDVRTQYDPLASIPGAGSLIPNQTKPTQSNSQYQQNNSSALNKSPINPLTGEVNPNAFQDQSLRSRQKKDAEKKLREEFDENAIYEETKFRRGYIIFFLTFPFALGASAGIATALSTGIAIKLVVSKSLVESFIMITGTGGLAGTNVYLDQQRIEEHRQKKKNEKKSNP